RLTDVLRDDLAEVDAEEVEPKLVREDLGRHRLARAAGAGEEDADAEAARALARPAPVVVDLLAPADVRRDLAQRFELALREPEVVPGRHRLDALRERLQARPRLDTAGLPQRCTERG